VDEADAPAGYGGQTLAHDGYRWALLGGLWLVYFCFGLIAASMAPLIPAIREDLGIDNAAMGAILGAWPLVYIGASIPCGILLDRLSPRISLLIGCGIIGLSSLARGLAENDLSLFVAVGLFGIGGPLISAGAPKLAAQWFTGQDRGFAIGVYSTGPALGSAAALALTASVLMPLLGENWRLVMFVYAGVMLVAGAAWFLIASHPNADSRAGKGDSHTAFSPRALLDIVSLPGVQILLAMAVGIFFVNHGMNNWLPEILRHKGMDAVQAGYWASLPTIVGIFGSLIVPRYATPARRLALIALIFLGIFAAGLLLLGVSGPALLAPLVLLGVARTSATAIVMLLLIELPALDKRHHGLLGGIFFVAAEIGGVLGPLTIGVLSEASGAFTSSLWGIAAISALLLVLTRLYARHDGPGLGGR